MKSGQYIWHTVGDDKVRASHAARDGKIFSWTSPPEGGHPGEDYNCRCWAEPVKQKASGLKQELITPVHDASEKWTAFDFAYHFTFGNGRAVTLPEIGYLGDVISASKQMIFTSLENQVADKIKTIKSGPLSYRTSNSYDFSSIHWVLGSGVVETLTVGDVTRNGNILTFKGEVSYTYSDEITDPISIRQAIRGHHRIEDLPDSWQGGAELFVTDLFLGRAYAVNGAWKTSISGSVMLKE